MMFYLLLYFSEFVFFSDDAQGCVNYELEEWFFIKYSFISFLHFLI